MAPLAPRCCFSKVALQLGRKATRLRASAAACGHRAWMCGEVGEAAEVGKV